MQSPDGWQLGDKVRVRTGPHKGDRGILQGEENDLLELKLDSGEVLLLEPEKLTNFSLAARRAWNVMPKRAGRPLSSVPRKKMVSMRLDIDLWQQLGYAVELGLIHSREHAVNRWIRECLDELLRGNLVGTSEDEQTVAERRE